MGGRIGEDSSSSYDLDDSVMTKPHAATYAFGPFVLVPAAAELRLGTARIQVTPKVFDLLLLLVENRGRLLSKQELLEAIWRGTHVEEGSLARAVASLRAVLQDDPAAPVYIETVARRGYKFVAEVREEATGAQTGEHFPFTLVIRGRSFPLAQGENSIGRAPECAVTVSSTSVSRRHAIITIASNRATLRDLASKNGTCVGGVGVEGEVELHDGDEIRFGRVEATFAATSATSSTLTDLRT